MWDLVGNPEDRFSHNEAHIVVYYAQMGLTEAESVERAIKVRARRFKNNMKHIQATMIVENWTTRKLDSAISF